MSLGLGSAVAALAASPAFVVIRPVLEHKGLVFALVGGLLALNGWVIYRWLPRRACPPGTVCAPTRRESSGAPPSRGARALFWGSAVVFALSLLLSYGLVPVLELMEWWRGEL